VDARMDAPWFPGGAARALRADFAARTGGTGRPDVARVALLALRAGFALRTALAGGTGGHRIALRTFRSDCAGRTLRPDRADRRMLECSGGQHECGGGNQEREGVHGFSVG
jgi:hypothetical protein